MTDISTEEIKGRLMDIHKDVILYNKIIHRNEVQNISIVKNGYTLPLTEESINSHSFCHMDLPPSLIESIEKKDPGRMRREETPWVMFTLVDGNDLYFLYYLYETMEIAEQIICKMIEFRTSIATEISLMEYKPIAFVEIARENALEEIKPTMYWERRKSTTIYDKYCSAATLPFLKPGKRKTLSFENL